MSISTEPDLVATHRGDWEKIRSAASKEPLARLALRALEHLELCVDQSVERIHALIGAYRNEQPVPRDDLWWSVYRNDELLLVLIAEGRRAHAEELSVREQVGVRRARQGLPVTDLLRAFRIGYAGFWESLLEHARALGPDVTDALVNRAVVIWSTLDEISSGVAEAHRRTTMAQDLDIRRRAMGFLENLRHHPADREGTEELARSLGLDPAGQFLVGIHAGHDASAVMADTAIAVDQPDRSVVVSQTGHDPQAAERALAVSLRKRRLKPAGIGLTRPRLDGAQQSLHDAELAYQAASRLGQETILFRDRWFEAVVLHLRDSLNYLADGPAAVLADDDVLRRTVASLLHADGKLTQAGEELHLHPNSVAYRLRQFTQITGVDPRTTQGAALARLALTYAEARDLPAPGGI